MSIEEEVELKDLLVQTMESNGCLAKIRAQLRASTFLALHEDFEVSNQQPFMNDKVQSYLDTSEGKAMFCIVHEFLEFFNLNYTLSVFEPESYYDNRYKPESSEKIGEELGLSFEKNSKVPILFQLITLAQSKSKKVNINLNVNSNGFEKEDSSESNVKTELSSTSNKSLDPKNLNSTFRINSLEVSEENYTPPDSSAASSVSEESVPLENSDKSVINNQNGDGLEASPRILGTKLENQKSDKKAKNNLSSLSDLPPLPVNKSRDILPSMYIKEFKDKSNVKEMDKMFDFEAEYEEDFMSNERSGNYLRSEGTKINLLEEEPSSEEIKKETESEIESYSEVSKPSG